jgi:hypothetical protein
MSRGLRSALAAGSPPGRKATGGPPRRSDELFNDHPWPRRGFPTTKSNRMTPAGPAVFCRRMRHVAFGIGHHCWAHVQTSTAPCRRQPDDVDTRTPATPGIRASARALIPRVTVSRVSSTTPRGCRIVKTRTAASAPTTKVRVVREASVEDVADVAGADAKHAAAAMRTKIARTYRIRRAGLRGPTRRRARPSRTA